jgi:outer membrane beta-barrel protein
MKNNKSIKMTKLILMLVVGYVGHLSVGSAWAAPDTTAASTADVSELNQAAAPVAEPAAEPAAVAAPSPGTNASAERTLDQQLDDLQVPTNVPPPGISDEKLYSVQSRFVSLRHRHEISLGGGRNFNSDSFVTSNNIDLGYRFYLSNRWFLSLSGSYVFNDWSNGANRLIKTDGTENSTLADAAFARYRADLLAGYHLFYGKFRVTMDHVFYFDQYVAFGPGYVDMERGNQMAAVGEIGLVFWFGRKTSMRLSFKDYFVREMKRKSTGLEHNIIGGLQVGYVFGG